MNKGGNLSIFSREVSFNYPKSTFKIGLKHDKIN